MIQIFRNYVILLFAFILFASFINVAHAKSIVSNKIVWQGSVSSNGKKTSTIRLNSASRYYIEASSYVYFGKWWKNRKSLRNDACYEFNAHPIPQPLPVFKNSMYKPVCDGKYHSNHIYRSAPFKGNNQIMKFWIFDTDYRDNSGSLRVKIYRVGSGGSGHTSHAGIQKGINLPGSDYRSFFQQRADPKICQRSCAAESRCKAWTYVKPGIQGSRSKCWLKHSVPRKVASSCCSSGVKKGSRIGGTYSGSNKTCRNLRPGDKYYSGWISCCDVGNGKSRWKKRSTGKSSLYSGTCKSWGINRNPPVSGGTTSQSNRNFCKNYANKANQQQRSNIAKGCGFRGSRWQNHYNNHYNWCMKTSRSSANSETNARTNQLNQCKKKRGGSGKVCRNLRKGDPYYSGWISCCDIAKGKSRWKKRSTGKAGDYNGTCKSWGIH